MNTIQDKLPKDIINLIKSYLPSKYVEMLNSKKFWILVYKPIFTPGTFTPIFTSGTFTPHYITIPIKYVIFDWNGLWHNQSYINDGHTCNIIPNEIHIGGTTPTYYGYRYGITFYCLKCNLCIIIKIIRNPGKYSKKEDSFIVKYKKHYFANNELLII